MKKHPMLPALLFEIGVEEIPSGYCRGARSSILAKVPRLFVECGWEYDDLKVYVTPRRLVIHATNFRPIKLNEEEKIGPLKEQAYQEGSPTSALQGFLKSTNREESDIFFKGTPRGTCVCVKVLKQYKPLTYFFETLPRQIEFPKLMRWEVTRYTFTRPIRWTFAFVGTRKQNYMIGDVKASDFTMGHRFLSGRKVRVKNSDFQAYEKLLLRHHVVLNSEERIKRIKSLLEAVHNSDEELMETVAHLVEEPFAVHGSFPKEYLKLPRAVLETCMKKQLKIFACYDSSGELVNRFVAIINGKRSSVRHIAVNYERVLCSRLEDARFFFREDTKTKLEGKVSKLQEMVFLGSLGSYFDKANRLKNLVEFLGKETRQSNEIIQRAKRAAYLAKADLTTHLVYEFPEIQGIAGAEYAKLDGESKEVASAILGHYLPYNLSEDFIHLKRALNVEGTLLGLADRIDLLVGAFSLGIEPSGSQDPYALRRAAGGIVKILRAHPLRFSLSKLIEATYKQYQSATHKPYSDKVSMSLEKMIPALISFFKERLVFELQVKAGTKEFEVLQAVLASNFDDVASVYERFVKLAPMIGDPSFANACKVMERTANILKGVKAEELNRDVDDSLFKEQLERELFTLVNREEPKIFQLIAKGDYSTSAKSYGDTFCQPIQDFFDRVKVNTDDPKIRVNRQALMKRVHRIYAEKVADLSRITNLS